MTHVAACALCSSNPHSGTNWAWVAIGFLIFGTITIAVAAHQDKDAAKRKRAGLPPRPARQPADISPIVTGLLTGTQPRSWYGKLNAVTPGGTKVTGRCCTRLGGHPTPDLASACAQRANARIARYGR